MTRTTETPHSPVRRHRARCGALLSLALLAAAACSPDGNAPSTATLETDAVSTTLPDTAPTSSAASTEPGVAPVFTEAMFEVALTEDIVYGQGLTQDTSESDTPVEMDLLLDVYEPVRDDDVVMPAIVMIHGGGFTGGSKSTRWISEWAPWFAERGWVVYSIDYRVTGDLGTIPDDYPPVPDGANGKQAQQWRALYPACRDAKAALRWVSATADEYAVDTDHVAVIGGSAGSVLAVTLGVSDPSDCTDEITVEDDPTLLTTNLDQPSDVATVIDHWGGTAILSVLELFDGVDRFDENDAPISIVHGTEDPTVPFSEAEAIRAGYDDTGVPYAWHPLEGIGHGAWEATIDGQPLFESAAGFIIETQSLTVAEPGGSDGS